MEDQPVDYRKLLLKYMYFVCENESVTYVPKYLPHLGPDQDNPIYDIDYSLDELAALRSVESELFKIYEKKYATG